MNSCEQLASQYLCHVGLTDIRHEPEGCSTPPDFAGKFDGKTVAVEVRRFDTTFVTPAALVGYDEILMPFLKNFEKILLEFGPPSDGQSWFVNYTAASGGPDDNWKTDLKTALSAFQKAGAGQRRLHIKLASGACILFQQAARSYETFFRPGVRNLGDAAFIVVNETIERLRECIDEKAYKMRTLTGRYDECWLVLTDYLSYGNFEPKDEYRASSLIIDASPFSRVVLLQPSMRFHALVLTAGDVGLSNGSRRPT